MDSYTWKDHFSKLAARYAAARPGYPAALFDYLASIVPSTRRAWDCACGSGQATLSLAERFEHVVATDASAAQVAAAPPHPRVDYRVTPAERSGLDDGSVELVAVAQALHWFDLEAFYAEAERVLRDGGVLAAWTYGVAAVEGADVDRLVQRFYAMLDPWWPPERRWVESGYLGLPFPFDELAAPDLTMQQRWRLGELAGYLRSWSAVGRYVADRGEEGIAAFESELESVWGDPNKARRVTWPLTMRAGRCGSP